MADRVELRVHGVSGTPPEAMLGLAAVPVDVALDACGRPRSVPEVAVWRRPARDPGLRAFEWGSLTSGRPSQALWLLLLPYVLANVAGWTFVPTGPRRLRAVALLSRLGGLAVTATFALSCHLVLADVLAAQALVGERGWPAPTVAAASALGALLVLALFRATRIQLRDERRGRDPWQDAGDPLGHAWLHDGQERLWDSPGTIVRLRRLHLAAGLGVGALMTALAHPGLTGVTTTADTVAIALAGLAVLLAVAGTALFTLAGDADHDAPGLVSLARVVAPAVAVLAVLAAVARLAGVPQEAVAGARWLPAIRGAGGWVAGATLGLAALAFLLQALPRGGGQGRASLRQAAVLPAFLLLAGAVGGGLGSGVALQAAHLANAGRCETAVRAAAMAPPPCPVEVGPNVQWLAIAFTWIATLLVWVLLVGFVRALRRAAGQPSKAMVAVADLTTNAAWLFALLGSVAAVTIAAGLAIAVRGDGLPEAATLPAWAGRLSTAALLVPVLAVVVLQLLHVAWRLPGRLLRLVGSAAVLGGIVGLGVLLRRGWSVEVLGAVLPPRTFLDLAQLVTLLLPVAAVVQVALYRGLRSREVRRGVGVLWDLGGFWPRWVHPFAPPTYSDRAVIGLREEVARRATEAPLLLAPHSQGTVIAAAALLATDPARLCRVALLTYGSPLGRLYAELYPSVFTPACFAALAARLDGSGRGIRWRNLYRASDPIGGAIDPFVGPARVDVGPLPDDCGRNHSAYWAEPAYAAAVEALSQTLNRIIASDHMAEYDDATLPRGDGGAHLGDVPRGQGR